MAQFSTLSLYDDPRHNIFCSDGGTGGRRSRPDQPVHDPSRGRSDSRGPGRRARLSRVLANVAEKVNISHIRNIFYSHQDPDVSSGITLWLSLAENAKVHISGLWVRFLPHFGVYDQKRIAAIPDQGGSFTLRDGTRLELIPSHFLHSTGQFSLYDPVSKILFSGDIGAAIFPPGKRYPVVEDFDAHSKLMEGFHKRYMASNTACRKWVDIVSSREISAIAPQHGAVMKGDSVRRFFDWFRELRCGVDLLDSFYGGHALRPTGRRAG